MSPVLDRLGQPITPGCIIAYSVQQGYSSVMRVAKVFKVVAKSPEYSCRISLDYRITVRATTDWYSSGEALMDKKTTLQSPRAIVVLREDMLSPELKALMDTIEV